MKSCFSLLKDMNTAEVMPAKHVTDAALTFNKKGQRKTQVRPKKDYGEQSILPNQINNE